MGMEIVPLHVAVSALFEVEYSPIEERQFVGVPHSNICIRIPPGLVLFGAVPGPLISGYATKAHVSFAPTLQDQKLSFTTAVELVTV